jgi:hypothetical protein
MKRLIAVLLLSAFSCGTFASFAADVGGKAKTELVKKSIDLMAVEQSTAITVDAPAVMPTNYIIIAEVNVKAQCRPVRATANAPPLSVLDNSPMESHRIRRLS